MTYTFDPPGDSTSYSLTGGAAIGPDLGCVSSPNALSLNGTSNPQSCSWVAPVTAGVEMTLGMFAQAVLGRAGIGLIAEVTDGISTWQWNLTTDLAPGTFGAWTAGTFTPAASTVTVTLRVQHSSLGRSPFWAVDNVTVGSTSEVAVALTKWDAMLALRTALQAIAGSPLNTNLEGRVYTANVLPDDAGGQVRPFVTLLATDTAPKFYQRGTLDLTWDVLITGYVDEVWPDEYASDGQEKGEKLIQDILDALNGARTLNGKVTNMEVGRFRNLCGFDPGIAVGSVEGSVTLTIYR